MATGTEFGLLGPLLVRRGGEVVAVQRGKQRSVLAALLLRAGQVVSLDELAEVLWGQGPPPSARVTIQNYVMRLRRALGDTDGSRISTQPRGYMIRVEGGELDVTRFEALLGAARVAARDGSWEAAATHSRAALELWRDEPLADVDSELLAVRDVPRLAELRLQALEVRIDADLHRGSPAEVIAELRQLAGSQPLRERLHALLMLALYRDGRQGEALAAYQAARQVLLGELGTEPGTGLRQLHQQMLAADPGLDSSGPARLAAGGVAQVTPQELPAAVPHFTGRAAELAKLTWLLDQPGQAPGTLVISAIGGTAGVGKTALALQWAHQVAARFPDGQLYVNLRGYDLARPVAAADALAGFLRALGVPGQDIPSGDDERAARFRTLAAGRRMLVLLDNAWSAEQVRPLLPGTPACATVVTSRDALAGLVARDGAILVDLDLLPCEDAVGLLRALIGPRVDDEPGAAAELADRCCRLPLALRLAAELAVTRPRAYLADLADELADQRRRLDLLDAGGDPRTAIRAVFSWSYQHLNTQGARAFRLAGLHPGHDLDRFAAAALTGTTPERAADVLGQLARTHLIQPAQPDRYGMHDLLRAYARELAAAEDDEEEQRAALTRLFDHYLHTAAAAMDTLFPEERHRRPAIARRLPAQPLTDPGAARTWLDAERATLVAAIAHAAAHGWPDHATALAATLFRYLDAGGYYSEAITIHTSARHAAHRSGDRNAEATALTSLGLAEMHQGSSQEAGRHLYEALTQHRQTGNQTGQARTLANLAFLDHLQGRYQQAADHLQQALAVHRQTGDRSGEAGVLSNLGIIDERQGRYQQAARHHQRALALCRETGNRAGEARALSNLARVNIRLGRCQEAVGQLQQALALCHQTGSRISQAYILVSLGEADLRQGHLKQAAGHQRRALALFREAGDRSGEVEALNGLGQASAAAGEPEQARTEYAAALSVARQIGDKYEQARAHDGLAHSYCVAGDHAQARLHGQQALTLYSELGAPEADQVRARLISAGCSGA
jgi:DNA-binding SARP family transcriptional activator/Tfp pilus assembly protein PilF